MKTLLVPFQNNLSRRHPPPSKWHSFFFPLLTCLLCCFLRSEKQHSESSIQNFRIQKLKQNNAGKRRPETRYCCCSNQGRTCCGTQSERAHNCRSGSRRAGREIFSLYQTMNLSIRKRCHLSLAPQRSLYPVDKCKLQ